MLNKNTDKTNKKPYKSHYKKKFDQHKNESAEDLIEKFEEIVVIKEKVNINKTSDKKNGARFEHKSIPTGLAQKLNPNKGKNAPSKLSVSQQQSHDQGANSKNDLNVHSSAQKDLIMPKKFNEHSKKNSFSSKQNHKKHNSFNEGKKAESKLPPVTLNTDKNEHGKIENKNQNQRKSFSKKKNSFGNKSKDVSKPFKHNAFAKNMNGDPKSCPYLNRMKNTKEEEFSESIEFEDDVKIESKENVRNSENSDNPIHLLTTVESENDGKDLLNSILNESFTAVDSLLWKPTNIIDINEINCDFEAPKLTENTSTVLMSNAEIEILNKRTAEKHPDDDGGPYVLKLTNLQKGFNSEEIVREVLKPKGILYLRTKFFWEPNFKVSFDEMKKMCFLEVKYFEEIDRCIQILKKNSYLIKAEKCKHDDFVKIAKLQNSQWGDPEFVNKADQLNYKILKYKVNLIGEPIGILKEGEEQETGPDKLPSLPTLGSLSKKDTKKNESVFLYSEMAEKIVKNKQKTKEQEEANKSNSSSAVNSPSMAASVLSSASLGNNASGTILSGEKTKTPRTNSSSTYTGSEHNNFTSNNNKGGWNKEYTKTSGKSNPNDGYKKSAGRNHVNGSYSNQNGYKSRSGFSTYNSSPKMNSEHRNSNTSSSTIGYGFAASFGRNAVP